MGSFEVNFSTVSDTVGTAAAGSVSARLAAHTVKIKVSEISLSRQDFFVAINSS
jgi:hypothetical protein